jgi:NAD(P)-dependent dehydrogenase (short-subunit alcohol dehydrogenase family)
VYPGTWDRAFAKVFTDAGAIVCVQDRKRADAEQHAAYTRKNGELGLILEADWTRPADVDALFRAIDEKFGRIDVLVSNHSIVKSIPLDEVDDATGVVDMTPDDRSGPTVHPTMTHFFYMDEKDQTKVRWWVGAVGPTSFG